MSPKTAMSPKPGMEAGNGGREWRPGMEAGNGGREKKSGIGTPMDKAIIGYRH